MTPNQRQLLVSRIIKGYLEFDGYTIKPPSVEDEFTACQLYEDALLDAKFERPTNRGRSQGDFG